MFLPVIIPILAFGFLLSDFNRNALQDAPLEAHYVREPARAVRGANLTSHEKPLWTEEYVVVKGDTLSKLASRKLGANTKANRDAIIALNPTLKQNPDLLIVGKVYRLPVRKT
jgi:nucleoid-associated protein YgaU